MARATSSISLADGFSARPPTANDTDKVVGLTAECDVAEYGAPDIDSEDVQAAWATPGFSLGKDNLIVEDDGGDPVGYLEILWGRAEVVVHPSLRGLGIGSYLLARAEAGVLERGVRTKQESSCPRSSAPPTLPPSCCWKRRVTPPARSFGG